MSEEIKKEEEFKLSEDQQKKYDSFEDQEEQQKFYDKIKLDWDKNNADPDADKNKPENKANSDQGEEDKKAEVNYKTFATKEDHANYMNSKTKSLKKTINQLREEIKQIKDDHAKKKFTTKIVFVKPSKNKKENSVKKTEERGQA